MKTDTENLQRAALHPLDQFRAFVALREKVQGDDGGWLEDPALLDRVVREKVQAEAEAIATESWKWIEVSLDLAYGYATVCGG